MNKQTPLNFYLPQELNDKINNMLTKRMVNGSKNSNEIIIILNLNETSTNVHDDLMAWLLNCLDTISDKVFDGFQYGWHIISQIMNDDYEDDKYIDEQGRCTKLTNTIVVAIHLTDHSYMSFDDRDALTIPYNHTPRISLSPQEIMDCLVREPDYIDGIGVSAVSSELMMDWWRDMISTNQNHFDVAGKGYMVHPMWIRQPIDSVDGENWVSVRETSFNFGWRGYKVDE